MADHTVKPGIAHRCHFAKIMEQRGGDAQRRFFSIEGGVCHGSDPFRAFHTVQQQAASLTVVMGMTGGNLDKRQTELPLGKQFG